MDPEKLILVFQSIHQVLRVEKLMESAGFRFELIPVPKEVNPECGLAIEIDPDLIRSTLQTLDDSNIRVKNLYLRRGEVFQEVPPDTIPE